jgi:hypothetical protein
MIIRTLHAHARALLTTGQLASFFGSESLESPEAGLPERFPSNRINIQFWA